MSKDNGEGAAVPASEKQGWTSFLKHLASFSGDLSAMTAPSFILSPTSLLEFGAYWGEPVDDLLAVSDASLGAADDEHDRDEERHLRILRYFLLTLPGQYTTRSTDYGSEKKPINPVLGEQFFGQWRDGQLKLVAEQVSHHPPVSAYRLDAPQHGLTLQGHSAQKTSFSKMTIVVKQLGHAFLRTSAPASKPSTTLITLPKLRIDGLWYGAPFIELADSSALVSDSGWQTVIEYKGKGYFGGKEHAFKATTERVGGAGPGRRYVIEGQWTGTSTITSIKGGSATPAGLRQGDVFHDGSELRKRGLAFAATVEPDTGKMSPMESRRVWKDVADGIRRGDFDRATAHKQAIEEDQRARRRDEQAKGQPFQLSYFDRLDDDDDFARLASRVGHQPSKEESWVLKKQLQP